MKGRGLISSCDHTKDTHCCRFLWINCQNDIQWLSNVCWCEMGLVNEGNYIRLTNKFQFPRSVCCEHSIWRMCQETQINIIRTFLFCCIWEASPSPSYEILHDFSSSLYRLRVWSLTLIIIHTHKRTHTLYRLLHKYKTVTRLKSHKSFNTIAQLNTATYKRLHTRVKTNKVHLFLKMALK